MSARQLMPRPYLAWNCQRRHGYVDRCLSGCRCRPGPTACMRVLLWLANERPHERERFPLHQSLSGSRQARLLSDDNRSPCWHASASHPRRRGELPTGETIQGCLPPGSRLRALLQVQFAVTCSLLVLTLAGSVPNPFHFLFFLTNFFCALQTDIQMMILNSCLTPRTWLSPKK
jgi:hypothetical protein